MSAVDTAPANWQIPPGPIVVLLLEKLDQICLVLDDQRFQRVGQRPFGGFVVEIIIVQPQANASFSQQRKDCVDHR
ncbi:hypothetical protein D3C81_1619030 [compost metagenome]